jgi:hypothetical protein
VVRKSIRWLTGIDAFCFAIALCYAITDLSALLSGVDSYPLAMIYSQATGSTGGTFGLLFIIFCSSILCCIGTTLTVSDRHATNSCAKFR